MRALLPIALACLVVAPPAARQAPAPHRQARRIMGTFCEIQVYHADAPRRRASHRRRARRNAAGRSAAQQLRPGQRVERDESRSWPARRSMPRTSCSASSSVSRLLHRHARRVRPDGGAPRAGVGVLHAPAGETARRRDCGRQGGLGVRQGPPRRRRPNRVVRRARPGTRSRRHRQRLRRRHGGGGTPACRHHVGARERRRQHALRDRAPARPAVLDARHRRSVRSRASGAHRAPAGRLRLDLGRVAEVRSWSTAIATATSSIPAAAIPSKGCARSVSLPGTPPSRTR